MTDDLNGVRIKPAPGIIENRDISIHGKCVRDVLTTIDDPAKTVMLVQRDGLIYELNATAAMLWERLKDIESGATVDQLSDELLASPYEITREQADSNALLFLGELSKRDLIVRA